MNERYVRWKQLAFPFGKAEVTRDRKQDHHLRVNSRGFYQMRITIDRGPKFVGLRRVIGLGTKDVHQARQRRDLILRVLNLAKKLSGETSVRSGAREV